MDLMGKYLSRVKPEYREKKLNGRKVTANTEIQQMIDEGVSTDGLEAINRVKSAFSGSTVIEVETNKREKRGHKSEKICAKCGKPGQRYCYGESKSGKHVWSQFCLECYPYHF